MFPDWSLILNQTIALAVVLAPLEVFILLNIAKFRVLVTSWLAAWSSPDARKNLFGEISHGVLRALSERAGSLKGAAQRSETAGLLELAKSGIPGGAAALGAIPGKIDLPVIGKVSIGEALSLWNALQGLMKGGGLGSMISGSTTGGAGYPK